MSGKRRSDFDHQLPLFMPGRSANKIQGLFCNARTNIASCIVGWMYPATITRSYDVLSRCGTIEGLKNKWPPGPGNVVPFRARPRPPGSTQSITPFTESAEQ